MGKKYSSLNADNIACILHQKLNKSDRKIRPPKMNTSTKEKKANQTTKKCKMMENLNSLSLFPC